MTIIVEILTVCFTAAIGIALLNTLGYKQVAGLITFISVCIVIMRTITLFNEVIVSIQRFIIK